MTVYDNLGWRTLPNTVTQPKFRQHPDSGVTFTALTAYYTTRLQAYYSGAAKVCDPLLTALTSAYLYWTSSYFK